MAEISQPPIQEKKRGRFGRFWRNLTQNPVTRKELRSRMRGTRAFVILTLYLLAMSLLISLIYMVFLQNNNFRGTTSREAGQAIFFSLVFFQIFLVAFIGPAFTAGSITGEKERQTYDLLRTTLLPARSLVMGKLSSALSYIFLLMGATLPLYGIVLMLGGVDFVEFAISQLCIIVAGIAFALWGLYASIRAKTTLTASVLTFAGTLFMLVGIPFLGILTIPLFDTLFFDIPPELEGFLAIGAMILAGTNLPIALGISEGFYMSEDAIWYVTETFGIAGRTYYIPLPWWIMIVIFSLYIVFIYWRCIKRIQKIPSR